jgi:hypothetical protein
MRRNGKQAGRRFGLNVAFQQQGCRALMLIVGSVLVDRLMGVREKSDGMKQKKKEKKTEGDGPLLFFK